ncbi:hypothetical protein [Paracoccus jiaweipingae]
MSKKPSDHPRPPDLPAPGFLFFSPFGLDPDWRPQSDRRTET